jgi:hypothetical protein
MIAVSDAHAALAFVSFGCGFKRHVLAALHAARHARLLLSFLQLNGLSAFWAIVHVVFFRAIINEFPYDAAGTSPYSRIVA